MALNPNSFRRGAIAAAAIAGASLLMTFSAAAQDAKGPAGCTQITDSLKSIKCEFNESVRRTDSLNNRADDLNRKADTANLVVGCTNFLLSGIKDGKLKREEILASAEGKVTPENACAVANKFGYGRKAEATGPAVN